MANYRATTADFVWKQGNTGPALVYTLTDNLGNPITLTGLSNSDVTFEMRSLTSPTELTLTGTTTILSPTAGTVAFTPSASDTTAPGNYLATFTANLHANGGIQSFPREGYLWGTVEPNLALAPQLIVDLLTVKDYMNITNVDRVRDVKLIALIKAVRPLIEQHVGPVVPDSYEEWHDGGAPMIRLLRRPSTGFGSHPVMQLIAASEYRGPIEYPLALVASPVYGSIYSVFLDPLDGMITRRTAGGRTLAFAPGIGAIHVWYRAGQDPVPDNIAFAACEAVRVGFEWTQQVGRGRRTVADDMEVGSSLTYELSRVIRSWLSPSRRAPSLE